VSLLGKGGMGEVYRAHDLTLDVPIAVKFVRSAGPEYRELMVREVRLAREVTHPTVCRVYDVGEADDQLYLTMEYVDGEDLSSLLKRIGRLPAHAKGVIHRDLKPANIMIDGKGKVRITDFGIAVSESEAAEGGMAGTPAYMAPEQLAGGELGPYTDLHAVGLILHEMLTGQTVFRAPSLADMFKQKTSEEPEPPSALVAGVDPRLDEVIARAVRRIPALRPQSALSVAAGLPGGDPLAMAVEAGATPNPSMVAAADVHRKVATTFLWILLGGLAMMLAGVLLLADPSSHFDDLKVLKPPAVLADRAERMLDDLGYDVRPDEQKWGFLNNRAAADPLWSVLFWYRERTPREAPAFVKQVMEASTLEAEIEVPEAVSHEALLLMLDHTGRLAYLHDGPTFGSHFAASPDPEDRYDWPPLLGVAGLDNAQLEADVESVLPVFSDVRAAWRGTDPDRPGQQLEVEAAAFDGRPVYFAVQRVDQSSQKRWQQLQRRSRLRRIVYTPLYWLVALTGLVLGVYNVVLGRSHLRGAAVLIGAVLGVELLAGLASAGGVSHPLASSKLAVAGDLVDIVTASLAVGLCYLGMEPFVRRRRPQTLIAWNRLLTGRVRDRTVGVSLLVGAVAGTGLAVLSELDRIVMRWLGLEVTAGALSAERLNASLGAGAVLGTALGQLNTAIVGGILVLFLGVLLSHLLRKPWLAHSVFVIALAAITTTQGGAHLPASWLTIGLPNAVIILFLLYRFGLLTVVASELAVLLLGAYPITTEPGAWFATGGYFAIAAVFTVGAIGFLLTWLDRPELPSAVGGRP
jgi:serine/threonine-protein kinase